jgi:asparagine synthase (glutamine-hydrolysing)
MCGIVAIVDSRAARDGVERAVVRLRHRGPDSQGIWTNDEHGVALGQTRLRIIDLSDAGKQPMASADGRYVIVFNGELYNYLELRSELADYPYRSQSDTEVVLAAWNRWGPACLDRFVGMFAFALWDGGERRLTAVRDRFGVKPLYCAQLADGGIALASEIKALHAAGVPAVVDPICWASFLARGITDQGTRTFWSGIEAVAAGSMVTWSKGGGRDMTRWYDLAARVGPEYDTRDAATVKAEYRTLLEESIKLRFRSDVPVGINLSGGLDSSVLLGLVHAVQGADSDVKVFSFTTGEPAYDELPWVQGMLERTRHPLIECMLQPDEVPELAARIAAVQDEPFGGLPTLAYAKLFARARAEGVIVLLDGQGMDEQWAGYDYYRAATADLAAPTVQGSVDPATRADCLSPELAAQAESLPLLDAFPDRLRNLQLRDALHTKLPRALRYNDRVSMASSTELREPFLDHRLFELAMRQPEERKIHGHTGKWLLRELTYELLPERVRLAPKRPLQTPQREWLRGPLRGWANELIERAFAQHAAWFDVAAARAAWQRYQSGVGDNSYWVWQWLSIGMLER